MDHSHHHHAPEVAQSSVQNAGLWNNVTEYFSQMDFMPHGHCYLWKPGLVYTHVISDFLIGLAYLTISLTLYGLVKKIKMPFNAVVISFGLFIGACGATHFMEIWNLWNADYWIGGLVKVLTAGASVATGIWLIRLQHPIVTVAAATKLAEQRRLDLEALTKDLEKRVKERTEELARAVKMRDDFLSMASHELKTPLTSMKLQAQFRVRRSQKEGIIDDESVRFYQKLDSQLSGLSNMVDDMLDISHIQAGKFKIKKEKDDLDQVVQEIFETYRPIFEQKGMNLYYTSAGELPLIMDKHRIEQVLHNLLNNAIKYAPEKSATISLEEKDHAVLLTVADTGAGIADHIKEAIFERYERGAAKDEISGLGLGLYISKNIVLAHGGKIWVEDATPQGAAFKVELPK
jgi:signal transduction histidine kinase